MVVGQPGSGKSTLARALATKLGVPVVHVDHIHWQPGWVERGQAEKMVLAQAAAAQEAWVIEGGHSPSWPERLARADTLVWLDMGVGRRLWRVLARAWRYRGRARPDMQDDCPEQFGAEMCQFLVYIWRTRRTARAGLARYFAAVPPGKAKVRLCSFAEADAWLAQVAA